MNENLNLIDKIEGIKNKSEERILILDEKIKNLENQFNMILDNYKNNDCNQQNDIDDNIDISILQQNIFEYIINERENNINNINNIFKIIVEDINKKNINCYSNKNIKILLNDIKIYLKEKNKEIENKNDVLKFQNKEINNKIKMQMIEQFEYINNRIKNEFLIDNDNINEEIINQTQNFLFQIKNQMNLEKLKR